MKKARKMKKVGDDAHHIFPQAFRDVFFDPILHIDIDDVKYGVWLEGRFHKKYAYAYNKIWKKAIDANIITEKNAMRYAKKFMKVIYGVKLK